MQLSKILRSGAMPLPRAVGLWAILSLAYALPMAAHAQMLNGMNFLAGINLQEEVDFRDPAGHLTLSRHYTSALVPTNPAKLLGGNWRHSFETELIPSSSSHRRLNRPSGNSYMFRRSGANWLPDSDVRERLVPVLGATGATIGWSVLRPDNVVEKFDAAGKLQSLEFPDGERVAVLRDQVGRVTSVSDRKGRSLAFTYEGDRLSLVTLPDSRMVRYGYDDLMRLASVTYNGASGEAGTASRFYAYAPGASPDLLSSIKDESGHVVRSWEYDASGRVVVSRHGPPGSDIGRLELEHGVGSTALMDAQGNTTVTSFEVVKGRLKPVLVSQPCGACGGSSQSITYDANGYRDLVTGFDGALTDYDYDARGLLARRTDKAPDGTVLRSVTTAWHPIFNLPLERKTHDAGNALVASTSWTYNTRGQALTVVEFDPLSGASRLTTTTYCEQSDVDAGTCPLVGLTLSTDGPRTDLSDVTSYSYRMADHPDCATSASACAWRKGDMWKVVNAKGQVLEMLRYDGAGRSLSTQDANGVVTDFEYDLRGRLAGRRVRAGD